VARFSKLNIHTASIETALYEFEHSPDASEVPPSLSRGQAASRY
jgi:hypothetical protein